MRDWNNDGKVDSKDYAMDQYILRKPVKRKGILTIVVLAIGMVVVF